MKVYLIEENNELKIVKVLPGEEESFFKTYGSNVIAAGRSVQEVVLKFSLSLYKSGQ